MSLGCIAAFLVVLATPGGNQPSPARKPLAQPHLPSKLPILRAALRPYYDLATQQWKQFDPQPQIRFDKREEIYTLTWRDPAGDEGRMVYDPPSKLQGVVEAAVSFDETGGAFTYQYRVRNLPTSRQRLQSFYLQTMAPISEVTRPDDGWMSDAFTPYLKEVFKTDGWTWADGRYGRGGIPPGGLATGFAYKSAGLPTAVFCLVSGREKGFQVVAGEGRARLPS